MWRFPFIKVRSCFLVLSVFSCDTNCTWHLTTRLNCARRGCSFIRILRHQPSVFIILAAITLSFRYNLYVILFIIDVVRHTIRQCCCTYIHIYTYIYEAFLEFSLIHPILRNNNFPYIIIIIIIIVISLSVFLHSMRMLKEYVNYI
jgi:hypothetical protein